ncbi:prolyl oligopeptidase family serine peptidase [Sphingorhabdus sp.]|uniref:prolyl oligopeptidase family serine peptidase n=1 Tax=Sphingorhabdus sp. TaxID=1902408 RepID=UPI003BAE36A2
MKNSLLLTTASLLLCVTLPNAANARPMTETDLASMKRLASPSASPDGKMVVYQVQETDLPANKRRSDLWLLRIDGKEGGPWKVGSKPGFNEHSPAFSADGKAIYYLSNESGSDQLWRYDLGSQTSVAASAFKTDISGFKFAPDGKKVAVWGDIARDCEEFGCDKDGDRSKPGPGTGREYDQLFVRHWDSWETPGNYSRIFSFEIGPDGKLAGGLNMDGDGAETLVGDSPSKPMGGGDEIAWSADSKTVYFALRKADAQEPLSTNLDIYASDHALGDPKNWTSDNAGTDTAPAPSPDGKYLAWAAMARAGYEADRQVLMLRDLKSGKVTALSEKWDRSIGSIAWAPDSKSLYVTAQDILDQPIFRLDLKGKVTRLTAGGTANDVIPLAGGSLLYTLNSVSTANDLYLRDAKGVVSKLTDVNQAVEAEVDDVFVQRFDFAGANGDQVWGQITKPVGVKGKLPVAFIVHGGPQGSFGNGWSFRWNPRVMAAQGYAVVSVDFHGSTGYGQKFTDAINKNWGGWPLEDLQKGLAAAGKVDAQIDITNACALGGSYGGYMMNWIAGNWPDGFKCLVNHAGIFDLRAMAFETEELWFDQWDHGGSWWQRKDAEKWNPVNHVSKWKTPTLVIHGEKDYRIPYSQSLATFTALQQQKVESKLLVFPDENHWVLKPQNSIQWHRTVFDWLGKHLKGK